jgi:hypothetical protein
MARVTFDQAAAEVVANYRINRKRSLADVQRRITLHLTPFFEHRRLSTIDKRDVRQYITARLDAGATNASVNRELAILTRSAAHGGQKSRPGRRAAVRRDEDDRPQNRLGLSSVRHRIGRRPACRRGAVECGEAWSERGTVGCLVTASSSP